MVQREDVEKGDEMGREGDGELDIERKLKSSSSVSETRQAPPKISKAQRKKVSSRKLENGQQQLSPLVYRRGGLNEKERESRG